MRNLQLSLSVIVAVFAFSPAGWAQEASGPQDKVQGSNPQPEYPCGSKCPKGFLPFAGAIAIVPNASAFSVKQTSASGGNAILGKTAGASQASVFASGTGSQGYGVYSVSSGQNSIAVQGYNTGTGNAGNFYMDNPNISDSGSPTSTANAVVYAATNVGPTSAFGNYGPAAAFVVNNYFNQSPAVYVQGSVNSSAAVYATTNTGNVGSAIYGTVYNGNAISGTVSGSGTAVRGNAAGSAGYAAIFQGGISGNGYCTFTGGPGWNCPPAVQQMKRKSEQVDPERVLRQLAAMPLYYYGMEGARDPAVRYLGPSAEDFKAAFDVGVDDETINSSNAQGVAFAAIQGLYLQLQAKDQEIAELRAENKALKSELDARLAAMESRIAGRIALTAQQHSDNALAGLQ